MNALERIATTKPEDVANYYAQVAYQDHVCHATEKELRSGLRMDLCQWPACIARSALAQGWSAHPVSSEGQTE